MNVIYNNKAINVSITNADVLESIDLFREQIEDFKKCNSIKETAACIRNIGNNIKKIVEASGENYSDLFPQPDYMDYLKFVNSVTEAFNSADFSEIKL